MNLIGEDLGKNTQIYELKISGSDSTRVKMSHQIKSINPIVRFHIPGTYLYVISLPNAEMREL